MQERELRASLLAVGPLLPVLVWRDRVVDGSKRAAICAELGLVPRRQVLHSLAECCSAVWLVHPDRAVEIALEHVNGVREIAELCTARVSEVAAAMLRRRGEHVKKETRAPRRTRSQKTVLVQLWVEPQLKHFIQRAGAAERLDMSAALRVAAWEYVQRTMARAPTEGGDRAPSKEWVKPPERRRAR